MTYHPDFFGRKDKPMRRDCEKRLEYMKPHVRGSLLDVGCSEGFFSFAFSGTCNPILAVDSEKRLIDLCLETQKKYGTMIDFVVGDIGKSIDKDFGIKWDTILYMSIHHHVIARYGIKKASEVIRWLSMSGKTMIFDMGQKNEKNCEKREWWNALPGTKDPAEWIRNYLRTNTEYKTIDRIGGTTVHGVERVLWKLTK